MSSKILLILAGLNVLSTFTMASTLSDVNNNLNQILMEILSNDLTQGVKNGVCSPYSVLKGLGLLYEGMGDESRQRVGIGFPPKHETFLKMFKTEGSFKSPAKTSENLVVVEDGKGIKYTYAASLNESMDAIAFRANFSSNPERALNFINRRIKSKTNDKIVDFLPPGSINTQTSMVLINVIYFNAKWRKEFNKDLKPGIFRLDTSSTNTRVNQVSTNFMSGDISAGYFKSQSGVEVISLPLEDENYSMVFVVPNTDVKTFIKTELRNPDVTLTIVNPDILEQKSLRLSMPKFSIKTRMALKRSLSQRAELKEFFLRDADYSRMANKSVTVDEVHHMAVMDVTQGGVEAAAATGITITLYSAFNPDHSVTIDRPFLHFIVEKPTKMILFAGYVSDPRE